MFQACDVMNMLNILFQTVLRLFRVECQDNDFIRDFIRPRHNVGRASRAPEKKRLFAAGAGRRPVAVCAAAGALYFALRPVTLRIAVGPPEVTTRS